MLTQYLIMCVMGRVLIYTLQQFPPVREVKWKLLREGLNCSFCLGVWTYSFLAGLFHIVLFEDILYFPILSEIFTGCLTSLLVYLVGIGFWERFGRTEVGG